MKRNFPTAMTPEEIAESCERAADLLEGHWTAEAWHREVEGVQFYCVEGGLAAVFGVQPKSLGLNRVLRAELINCPVYTAVQETLELSEKVQQHIEDGLIDDDALLAEWNDNVADEQEVLDTLRATAKRVLGVAR